MAPRLFPSLLLLLSLTYFAGLLGCSTSGVPPRGSEKGVGWFEGDVDPATGKFVIQSIEVPGENGAAIQVVLLGDNVQVDAENDVVRLDVTIRNDGAQALYAPAQVLIGTLLPATVEIQDFDSQNCPGAGLSNCEYGLVYSHLLGKDKVLSPNEESEPREWVFRSPDLQGFTFSARTVFALDPNHPSIAGSFFLDQNLNGRFETHEPTVPGGVLHASGPDLGQTIQAGEDGHYELVVDEPGLYTLTAISPEATYTTANPLLVILPVDDYGNIQSVLNADFGIVTVANAACSDFNDGTLQGWTAQAGHATVAHPSLDGTDFMLMRDAPSPPTSAVLGPSSFFGDWSQAQELSFDFILYDDGYDDEHRNPKTVIVLVQGPGVHDGIRAAFVPDIRITDSTGEAPGWHHIVAPVYPVSSATLPANEYGHWIIQSPTIDPVGDWNTLVGGVGAIWFPLDISNSPADTERMGVDNFCLGVMNP